MDLPGGHGRVQREHLGIITLPDDAGGGADATVRALFQLQSDALKAAQAQADASRAEIGALQARIGALERLRGGAETGGAAARGEEGEAAVGRRIEVFWPEDRTW